MGLSLIGLGETNLFGTSWDKFWFRLSNKALAYVNSDSGEGDTIQLENIVAVIPEDVDDVSCLLLKVAASDGTEKCHRLRALPDEHGQDNDLLQVLLTLCVCLLVCFVYHQDPLSGVE